jgi:hypothetical protein
VTLSGLEVRLDYRPFFVQVGLFKKDKENLRGAAAIESIFQVAPFAFR